MSQEQVRTRQPLYTQIDVSPGAYPQAPQTSRGELAEQIRLLRELVAAQDRQNELLEELVNQLNSSGKQRATELGQWKAANPHLARSCRLATEALGKVQTEFLETLTQEINTNYESLMDGEFMLNEFVDRFGPRMAHLNGLLQVLSQLMQCPTRLIRPILPEDKQGQICKYDHPDIACRASNKDRTHCCFLKQIVLYLSICSPAESDTPAIIYRSLHL